MAPHQDQREFRARVKFNTVAGLLKRRRVVVVDDSLVRGTTLKQLLMDIRKAGAAEVHVRICSPPIIAPCFYGMDFPTRDELIASDLSVEEIRRYLKVDTLGFLSLEGDACRLLRHGRTRVLRRVLHRQLSVAAPPRGGNGGGAVSPTGTAGNTALDGYRARRDFSRTPEPAAGADDGGARAALRRAPS